MAYDRDSFLAGLAVGRTLWKPHYVKSGPKYRFLFSISTAGSSTPYQFSLYGVGRFLVEWGDGSETDVTLSMGIWHDFFHRYSESGVYQITVNSYKEFSQLNLGTSYDNYGWQVVSLDSPVPPCWVNARFSGLYHLSHIPGDLLIYGKKWTSAFSLFQSCQELDSIPEGLFDQLINCTNFDDCFFGCSALYSIPNELFGCCRSAQSFEYAFWNSGIHAIPYGLFHNCPNARSFDHAFERCYDLVSIPSNLFAISPQDSSFRSTFNGCSGILSSVPELWNTHPNTSHSACFRGCTNAENYAEIPSGWK